MQRTLSTTILVKEHGDPHGGVCSCCGRRNLYAVNYLSGLLLLLCAWCDLHVDDRWVR